MVVARSAADNLLPPRDRGSVSYAAPRARRADASRRCNAGIVVNMSWLAASWLLLGGSTMLLFLGLPVAFSFLAINIVGAILFLGGEPGLVQLARYRVYFVVCFF